MIRIIECCFFSGKDRKLTKLEWRGIFGERNTTILSTEGHDGTETHENFKNTVTKSGKRFAVASQKNIYTFIF